MEGIGVDAKGWGEEGKKWWKWEDRRGLEAAAGIAEEKAEGPEAPGLEAAHPQTSLSTGPPLKIPVRIRKKELRPGGLSGQEQ
jgi:hypothetical protein